MVNEDMLMDCISLARYYYNTGASMSDTIDTLIEVLRVMIRLRKKIEEPPNSD